MITPQRHVRNWLHEHNTRAIELSAMADRSKAYVSGFLLPSGANLAAIKVLDKFVHFPPEILQAAEKKHKSKKRQSLGPEALRLHMDLIRAWKAPKEVV